MDQYRGDLKLRSATERQLQILAEAGKRLSASLTEGAPDIPWRAIVGLRNVLVPEYGEIDDERVWRVATSDVPSLIPGVERLLRSLGGAE